jgi:putative endonuclease
MSLFYFYENFTLNYTVYILYSQIHNQIYIGFTSNLLNRFKSHNQLGHDWTAKFRPWMVVYCEYFFEKKEAMHREKQLKQYRQRLKIRKSIESEFQINGFISLKNG